jgi:hypothetical protein
LKRTTKASINLVQYLFESFEIKYVLLGKFQTDKLEGRFGKYRQMSGSHFHVSITQNLESEKKLIVLSLLKLKSAKFGTFSLIVICIARLRNPTLTNREKNCRQGRFAAETRQSQGRQRIS